MNAKERFTATFRFQEIDRPFFMPAMGAWKETVERWRKEGLPWYVVTEIGPMLYFNFDLWIPIALGGYNQPGLFPPLVPRILERKERYRIVRDWTGNVFKEFTDGSSSIPQFMEAPVKTMDDFEKLKWRLDPEFPGRCVNPVSDIMALYAKRKGFPLYVMVCGIFGFHRFFLGDEELMTAYYDKPELVHEMSRQWVKLHLGAMRKIINRYDVIFINYWEDMCYRNGPLISPKTFKEFMSPYYKEVIDDAKNLGIEFFGVDTDGNCTILIPLFEEAGVNMMYPFEVQAGMDILKVREQHPKLVIYGGLDKRVLAKSKKEIEEMVFGIVPKMLKSGGYIPSIDHSVPPDVPLDNFKYFMELMKSRELLR